MVKHFGAEEFIAYVSGLKFEDIRDVIVFCDAYRDSYVNAVENKLEKAEINRCFLHYSLAMAVLGGYILKFCNNIFKELENDDQAVQSQK